MEQTPVLERESAALATLKARILNPGTPTLDIGRGVEAHLKAYPETKSNQQLAEKLGLPQKRTFLGYARSLLRLPVATQQSLEGKVLTMDDLYALTRPIAARHPDTLKTREDTAQDSQDIAQDTQDIAQDTQDTVQDSQDIVQDTPNKRKDTVSSPENTQKASSTESYGFFASLAKDLLRVSLSWMSAETREKLVSGLAGLKLRFGGVARLIVLGLAVYGAYALYGKAIGRMGGEESFSPNRLTASSPDPGRSAPRITSNRLISGNRLELRWQPQAPGTRYQVYWTSRDQKNSLPIGDAVFTPGAVVSINHVYPGSGLISVKAIAADDSESGASVFVPYEATPVNQSTMAQPLPLSGEAVDKNSGRPELRLTKEAASGSSNQENLSPKFRSTAPRVDRRPGQPQLSPPSEVHAEVLNPDLIRLSWRAVGNDVRYNVYSSALNNLSNPRKENAQPLKSNIVDWTPETGLPRYWVVVTTLGQDGRESAYSEAIEVIRNPEKSKSSKVEDAAKDVATDAATGLLRKAIPW